MSTPKTENVNKIKIVVDKETCREKKLVLIYTELKNCNTSFYTLTS